MTDDLDWVGLEGQSIVDALVKVLDLQALPDDVFVGRTPKVQLRRVFGGQVAAQALVAAGRTVPTDRAVHSLHSYFLRGGDPSTPIQYHVERARDGGSFSVRRVIAEQDGSTIFVLSASFQLSQEGIDHQSPMPEVPAPESLPTVHEREVADESMMRPFELPLPFDIRYVDEPSRLREDLRGSRTQRIWLKANGELPDDPLVHVCIVTFASDLSLLTTVLSHHGLSSRADPVQVASLDHAMWFHRPVRADEWFLYVTKSPSASGGRGLATGRIFSRDGRHMVSVAQEGMIRLPGSGVSAGPSSSS